MDKYQEVVYGNYKVSHYPRKLGWKLIWDHMREAERTETNGRPKGSKILDVGAGDGTYVRCFNSYGFQAYGIEANVNFKYHIPSNKIVATLNKEILDFNKDKLPYEDNTFDYVFSKSVIEHVYNTEFFLSEIKRVLKPKGKLLILTPAWDYNYRWFYDDPTHVKPFNHKGLQDALRLADFKQVKVKYFYHLPFVWKYTKLGTWITRIIRLLPDEWRWWDWEQQKMNVLIRFSKEVQLLGIAEK